MFRYAAQVSYVGSCFAGFQRQPNLVTVQGALEESLSALAGEGVTCTGAGRTDAGVHARGQVVHFDMPSRWDLERLRLAIRARLPRGLEVIRLAEVPGDFHARFDARWREYRYLVWNARWCYPHMEPYVWPVRRHLDLGVLRELAGMCLGRKDFGAFCRSADRPDDSVRTMMRCSVRRFGHLLVFTFRADGFLTNMIRILVGTMLEVEAGRMSRERFASLLEGGHRSQAGRTCPPQGLFFWRVGYDPSPWGP
ncbi:tRNA pseudouridine(38-40) synthase TruA [Thermanaerovibrio acidaminovorans]|uniref:tRNA pseudouridine(38-40) synthase TruA n=1 Tax=Thermanaerovibrio acidaminovorans TaxID=81462 RepID=UPI002490DEA5|nr:tRNA pseudouridine(38-40) synthase TruA [Thermanaerovibrio acidaminovorans]